MKQFDAEGSPLYKEIKDNLKLKLFLPFKKEDNLIIEENFNSDVLSDVIRNMKAVRDQFKGERIEWFDIISKGLLGYMTSSKKINTVNVTYSYASGVVGVGRLFAKGTTMQRMHRELRNSLADKFYIDLDIVNAHPTIYLHLCKMMNAPHKHINDYVTNRKKKLDLIIKAGATEKEAKNMFFNVINGGLKDFNAMKKKPKFLINYKNEIFKSRKVILKKFPLVKKFIKEDQKKKGKKLFNIEGKSVNLLMTTVENHILMAVCALLKSKKVIKKSAVLMFDGVMIPKITKKRQQDCIKASQQFVKKELNISIKLKIKPFEEKISLKEIEGPLLSRRGKRQQVIKFDKTVGEGSLFFTDFLFNKKFFRSYRLTKPFDIPEEYKDDLKPMKDVMTDLVNSEFLRTNDQQIKLIKLINDKFKPFLKKYNAHIIYYGGNPMRIITRNIKEYLDPHSDEILDKIFGEFVKKSDNDFSLMHQPPGAVKDYNSYYANLVFDATVLLDEIRNEINKDLMGFLEFFKYNKKFGQMLLDDKLKVVKKIYDGKKIDGKKMKVKSIKMEERKDQLLIFREFAEIEKGQIDFYTNKLRKSKFLYNSYNNALEFRQEEAGINVKFSLLRTKVNFAITTSTHGIIRAGGELIDIGIPHMGISSEWQPYTKQKFNDFIKNHTHIITNEKTGLTHKTYGLEYTVYLLFKILYFVQKFPWNDSKFAKRIARIYLFTLFWEIGRLPVNLKSIRTVKKLISTNKSRYLKMVDDKNKELKKDLKSQHKKQFDKYMKSIEFYRKKTIDVCDSIIKFYKGKDKVKLKKVFDINL